MKGENVTLQGKCTVSNEQSGSAGLRHEEFSK